MKRILTAALAVLLFVSLVACDNTNQHGGVITSDTDTDAVSETKTGTDTDAPDDGKPREVVYRLLSKEMYEGERVVSSLRYGYDDKGRLTYVREDGKTSPHLTVAYGEGGEVSEITDSSRMKVNTQRFENGNLVFVGGYVGGTLIESREFVYDEGSRLLSDTEYSEEGSVIGKREYEYELDERGNATAKYEAYTNKNTLVERYEYDGDGNLVKTEYYYGRVAPENVVCTEYDETGKTTLNKYYSSREGEDGPELYLSFVIEYEYTDGGIKTERHYNLLETDGTAPYMTKEYEYENGLLISVYEIYSTDKLPNTVETFEYDDKGNLTMYEFVYYEGGDVAYEKKTAYTWREFSLTEEEIAANEANDVTLKNYVLDYMLY